MHLNIYQQTDMVTLTSENIFSRRRNSIFYPSINDSSASHSIFIF